MGTVVQKFDADGRAVERELEKIRKEYDKLLHKMDGIAKTTRRQQKEATTDILAYAKGVATATGSVLSLQAALQMVTKEMGRQRKLHEDAAKQAVTIAESQSVVRHMIGDTTTKQFNAFLDRVKGVQLQSGFGSLAQLNLAAADTLSATGGNQDQTLEILAATAPLVKNRPGDLSTFSAGVGDLMNTSGLSAKESAALAVGALGQARINQLNSFKEIAKSIGSGASLLGDDPAEATKTIAALFGSIGRDSKDPEGATTKTAVLKILKTLEEFGGDGTFDERLSNVQAGLASGELSEAKLMAGVDAGAFGTVRKLFRADLALMNDLTATLANVRGDQLGVYDRMVEDLKSGTPEIRFLTDKQRREASLENRLAGDDADEMLTRQAIIDTFAEATKKVRTWTPGNLIHDIGDFVGENIGIGTGDDLDMASTRSNATLARHRIEELNRRLNWIGEGGGATQESDRTLLRDAITQLKSLLEAQALNAQNQQRRVNASAQAAVHVERD